MTLSQPHSLGNHEAMQPPPQTYKKHNLREESLSVGLSIFWTVLAVVRIILGQYYKVSL